MFGKSFSVFRKTYEESFCFIRSGQHFQCFWLGNKRFQFKGLLIVYYFVYIYEREIIVEKINVIKVFKKSCVFIITTV